MKAIIINDCKNCPHYHSWSSGGKWCYESEFGEHGKMIVPMGGKTEPPPAWCPLPNVKYN